MLPFYPVGHSTRGLDEFVELLRAAEISLVVDIRTVPKSRANPQYNQDVLPDNLAAFQIGYEISPNWAGCAARQSWCRRN